MTLRIGRLSIALALCGALLVVAACREEDGPQLPDAFAYLPSNTSVLLVASVSAFAGTPGLERLEHEALETDGLGDILREADISLSEAVDTLYIALSGAVSAQDLSSGQGASAVVHTMLPENFLPDLMARSGESFREERVDGETVWVLEGASEPIAAAALPGGHLGFGTLDSVRDMVRRAHGKLPGLTADASVISTIAPLDATAAVWGVAQLDEGTADQAWQNPLMSGLSHVKYLTWTANHDAATGLALDLNAICGSADEAQQVKSYVQTLVGLAALGQQSNKDLATVLNALTITTTGDRTTVHVVVPPDVLQSWMEDADGIGRMLPGRS